MKICSKCKVKKENVSFGKCSKEKSGLKSRCKMCRKEQDKIIYNTDTYREYHRGYISNNKEKVNITSKKNYNKRKNIDPTYKIKKSISRRVYNVLKNNKNGSFLKYLEYKLSELKEHIEAQFKLPGNEWMSWDNWGKYSMLLWDDNDSSTWVWNLDHIIPQKWFNYTSMKDKDFTTCWSLKNLRPYSAKLNVLEKDRKEIYEPIYGSKVIK